MQHIQSSCKEREFLMAITECYQKLAPWLTEPISRINRVYLETHLELLASEFEHFLELLIREHHDHPYEQQLRIRQQLLHDARERGGTVQAVRAAYVNMFGGLILDLPVQLAEVEQQLTTLSCVEWTGRIIAVCKMQLNEAIECAPLCDEIVPEIVAELQYQLGKLFAATSSRYSSQVLTRIIAYYELALQVYTSEHYPLQHAKILIAVGDAYMRSPAEEWIENLDKAMYYYKAALHSYSNAAIPALMLLS